MSSRPLPSTVRRLFALSRNRCAFPGCTAPIVDAVTGTVVADVCHIRAQSTNGPRFEPNLSADELHLFENLILFCRNHHKVVDASANLAEYTVSRLTTMKAEHEGSVESADAPTLSRLQLQELIETIAENVGHPVHMDFREANFRVGGEGGQMGGAGGGGGVLTIVGTTRVPPEAKLELKGGAGQGFGAGGGGGGALRFEGRPADKADQLNGLRVCSLLPVNAFHLAGLMHLLGAGWTFMPVAEIPSLVTINVAGVLDLGLVRSGDLLRFELEAADPKGHVAASEVLDLPVPDQGGDLTPKALFGKTLRFEVSAAGVWTISLRSGDLWLAQYELEIRLQQRGGA